MGSSIEIRSGNTQRFTTPAPSASGFERTTPRDSRFESTAVLSGIEWPALFSAQVTST